MSTDAPQPDQPWDPGGETPQAAALQASAEPPVASPPAPPPAPGSIASRPPEPPAAPGPPAAPAPGGIYPAGATILGEPVVPIASAPAPKRRGRLVGGVVAGAVVLGGLLLKFGLPIIVGTAASGLLGGVFGGPFEKLPQDRQDALEKRIDTAMADTLKGLDDAQKRAKVNALLAAGLPRLADEDLSDKIHLTVTILNTADVPTCARLARANVVGKPDPDAVSDAVGGIDTASIERWFDINVTAIEAEVAGTPPARSVDPDEASRIFQDVAGMFSASQTQHVDALYNGGELSDADACDAIRAVYGTMEKLPPADLAVAALYDVSP